MEPTADRVTIPAGWLWLFRLGGPVLGAGLAFAARPAMHWIATTLPIDGPGVLRLAASVPRIWLVPALVVLGAVVGAWLAAEARRDAVEVRAEPDGLRLRHRDASWFVPRDDVAAVFTDPRELVVLDRSGAERFRGPAADLSTEQLAELCARHGYPWGGTRDPHESAYREWADGQPDLTREQHALLRRRRHALSRKDSDAAAELRDRLAESAVIVRDRNSRQEVRSVPAD